MPVLIWCLECFILIAFVVYRFWVLIASLFVYLICYELLRYNLVGLLF